MGQAAGGVMVWGIIYWFIVFPLVKPTAYLSVIVVGESHHSCAADELAVTVMSSYQYGGKV